MKVVHRAKKLESQKKLELRIRVRDYLVLET